jgi:hypothetical protein
MIGGGAHFQVSGLGHQVPGSGVRVRVQVQEICHPSSAIDSGGGWQLQVAGGGFYPFSPQCSPPLSPPLSPPILPLSSVICHLLRWRVAAPGGRWQALSIQPSTQPSIQSSMQQQPPDPTQRGGAARWKRLAVGGWEHSQGKLGQHAVLPLPQGKHSPDTPYSILSAFPSANRQPLKPFRIPGVS